MVGCFHLLFPPLHTSQILIRVYKAEALSGKEESSKSPEALAGGKTLLLEGGPTAWGAAWGLGQQGSGMMAKPRFSIAPHLPRPGKAQLVLHLSLGVMEQVGAQVDAGNL